MKYLFNMQTDILQNNSHIITIHNKCQLATIQELKNVDVSRQDGEET